MVANCVLDITGELQIVLVLAIFEQRCLAIDLVKISRHSSKPRLGLIFKQPVLYGETQENQYAH